MRFDELLDSECLYIYSNMYFSWLRMKEYIAFDLYAIPTLSTLGLK